MAGLTFTLFGATGLDIEKKCTLTPEETEGPFPTHEPENFLRQNIIGDRKGAPLSINIGVYNVNKKCSALQKALVDIWHCDSNGEYSEYGGKDEHGGPGGPPAFAFGGPLSDSLPHGRPAGRRPPGGLPPPRGGNFPNQGTPPPFPPMGGSMQAADHTQEHFLRGRQLTNKTGSVSFSSIYPGWYPGRAPHIHVHVYDQNGKSLLVTQIAFPAEVCWEVYSKGVYESHGQPETSNEQDNVFGDGFTTELAKVSGSFEKGFVLNHSIFVEA